MKTLSLQWVGILLVLTGILFGGYFVYAEDGARTRDFADSGEDRISAQDRTVYARDRVADQRGITFRRHERTCVSPDTDEASCHARVITTDAGKPLATTVPGSALRASQLRSAYGVSGISAATKDRKSVV